MIALRGQTGDFEANFGKQSGTVHTLQFAVRDGNGAVTPPDAGSVTITVRTPGADTFEDIEANVFDLTNRGNWIQVLTGIHIGSMHFACADLDAGKTLDVTISSSFGSS